MEFKHISVLLDESIDGLDIKPNGIYVDGTVGGAGHSEKILSKLTSGKLICFDKDEEALAVAKARLEPLNKNCIFVHRDFKEFREVMDELGIDKVDGILLDLGVSSYQIDNIERGFSYRESAKLDMRMNRSQTLSAYEVVNNYPYEKLVKILYEYSDERFARRIVSNIVRQREIAPIENTNELVNLIEKAYPSALLHKGGSVSKKTFQALRIEVNGELDKLSECLKDMVERLASGGRICVITFHSLEDRIVKHTFKELATNCICPPSAIICVCNHKASIELVSRKPILPSQKEMEENSRSQSAKLRIAMKL